MADRRSSEVLPHAPEVPTRAPDLESIYRSELAYVFQTLRYLGVRPSDVEDAAHEVFLVVHRRIAEYDPARPLRAWLFGIAYRVAAHDWRQARRDRGSAPVSSELVDHGPDVEEQVADRQAWHRVVEALAHLDLDQRAVFVLHDIEGTPVPRIAETLGLPVNTVYSRLRLARARFTLAVRRLGARTRNNADG